MGLSAWARAEVAAGLEQLALQRGRTPVRLRELKAVRGRLGLGGDLFVGVTEYIKVVVSSKRACSLRMSSLAAKLACT